MSEFILGIDQGTTGTKVLLFNQDAVVVSRAYKELKQYYPKPGWVEHDPEEIWESTLELIQQVLCEPRYQTSLRSIAITNQRETALIWDKQTGKPLHKAIVWQCRRSAEICQQLKMEGFEAEIRAKTGLLLDPYFSGTKVRWIMENDPQIRSLAEQGRVAFGTVDSWLIWNLTGGRVHATDCSNASRTLMYDCVAGTWDEHLASLMMLPLESLPRVCDSGYLYGYSVQNGLLPDGIPITGVIGDSQGALFGQACFQEGMAKATFGTGTSLMVNTGKTWVKPKSGLVSTVAWRLNGETTYAMEGIIHVTGGSITWLRDGLGIIDHPAQTEELARALESNDGVYLVPAFVGLGIPYWDTDARGVICGLTRGTTKNHLARAAIESIAYQVKDALETMLEGTGAHLVELKADGGASSNSFLMQFQSDILDIPVSRPGIEEVSVLGAVYLSGLTTGLWSNLTEIARRWQEAYRYNPHMDSVARTNLYNGWKQAVKRALSNL